MKTCPNCGETKSLSDFYKRRGGKPNSYCKQCQLALKKRWMSENVTGRRSLERSYRITHRYSLSPEEQQNLPDACEMCGATENLHIDHDHSTGVYRGVLCVNHNIGIGRFQDDPDLLRAAAEYLESANERRMHGLF